MLFTESGVDLRSKTAGNVCCSVRNNFETLVHIAALRASHVLSCEIKWGLGAHAQLLAWVVSSFPSAHSSSRWSDIMDGKQPSSSSSTGISAAPTAVTPPPLAHIPSGPGHAVSSSVYHHPTHNSHLKFGDIEHTTFAHAAARDKDASEDKHCEFERVDALARRTHSSRRYLFRRPRPLQYFRGNTLVRDPCERTSERLE